MALMLTDVPFSTVVVNGADGCVVDSCQRTKQNSYVRRLLADRLEWVLEHRAERVGNASQWGLRAHLSRTYVRTAIRRSRETGGQSSIRADEAVALAETAGVSLRWLITGEGSPDAVHVQRPDDEYPKRKLAIDAARKEGLVSEKAIATAQSLDTENFRFYSPAQWGELMSKLTLAEQRNNPDAFYQLIERAREKAAEEAEAARAEVAPPPAKRKRATAS